MLGENVSDAKNTMTMMITFGNSNMPHVLIGNHMAHCVVILQKMTQLLKIIKLMKQKVCMCEILTLVYIINDSSRQIANWRRKYLRFL